jgi:hypothetical protein
LGIALPTAVAEHRAEVAVASVVDLIGATPAVELSRRARPMGVSVIGLRIVRPVSAAANHSAVCISGRAIRRTLRNRGSDTPAP